MGEKKAYYNVESHWSKVAGEISNRTSGGFIAGDDDPFHRYKREKFEHRVLSRLDVAGKQVLELGCGPGGNLLALVQRRPKQLVGVDISESMLTLARDNLAGHEVTLKKTDGRQIPLPDHSVDLAYTVTVLQHNVDPTQLDAVVSELCRVARDRIVLAEDIGNVTDPPPGATYVTRPVESYRAAFAEQGFKLVSVTPLGLRCSRFVRRVVGKVLLRGHSEGEPITGVAAFLLKASLPITIAMDRVISDRGDLTVLELTRTSG
jgi:SAM-dependent methyltransferase